MAQILPPGDQGVNQPFDVIGRADDGQHFQIAQAAGQRGRGGEVADAQAGRQGFGKSPNIDHPLQLVQGGQTGGAGGQDVGEGIILHDGHAMLGGDLQQLVRHSDADGAAGRVVGQGLGEEKFGFQRGDLGGELLQIRAVRPPPHPGDRHLGQRQLAEQRVIAGAVHQRAIARLQQMAANQVQRVVGPLGQQNPVGRGDDGAFGQRQGDPLAQGAVAPRAAIAMVKLAAAAWPHQAGVAANLQPFHPAWRRAPVADADAVMPLQLLAQQRNMIDGVGQMRRTRLLPGFGGAGDRVTGPLFGFHPSHGDQPVIGVGHGVL